MRTMEHNGRLRKLFTITDAGRRKVTDFLANWEEIAKIYAYVKEASERDEA